MSSWRGTDLAFFQHRERHVAISLLEFKVSGQGTVGLKRLVLDHLDSGKTLLKSSDAILINYGTLSEITQRTVVGAFRRQSTNAFLHTLGQKRTLRVAYLSGGDSLFYF